MPNVGSITAVVVKATYKDFTGNPLTGTVDFVPSNFVQDGTSKNILLPSKVQATVTNGVLNVEVLSTNDPDETFFVWQVTERFTVNGDNVGRSFQLNVPYNSPVDGVTGKPTLDLATVAAAQAVAAAPQYVLISDFNNLSTQVGSLSTTKADSATVSTLNGRVTTLEQNGASGAASGISFVPTGNISSTTVQDALVELDGEKSNTGHTHTLALLPGQLIFFQIYSSTSGWPDRGYTGTDKMCIWVSFDSTAPDVPSGGLKAVAGLDSMWRPN